MTTQAHKNEQEAKELADLQSKHDRHGLLADLNAIIDSGEPDHMVMLKQIIARVRKEKD